MPVLGWGGCLPLRGAPGCHVLTIKASMIPGLGPVIQAVLGTFLTWGLTAAGSALVFVFSSGQRRILDGSLGFAAGGFSGPSHAALALSCDPRAAKEKQEQDPARPLDCGSELSIRIGRAGLHPDKGENGEPYQRRRGVGSSLPDGPPAFPVPRDGTSTPGSSSWRRIMLMILAITIHNIPEGLAVGVGFGAIGKSASATFQSARNLAIGIGIQNFPEGLAVSLPLRGAGFSTWKAFWYGQLSGMVEPLAGVFGAFAVVVAEPLLPYALGFAAGAMVYVVMDDIIPEAQTSGNGKLASWTSILGFVVMMSLDVGLG
ncbi:zinc transporter ZIP11 isoform X4 [Neopelma chrysocephalum]|uniref:zinc transporter ZIP11 isoform X4 n=1 Tax=Neopelma chrysocephalum TaxID=114329 RepID=UPI000FCD406A|nr:zinc transporter ZIP11 isoform X4 [Neopelma chrysocephalum]